MPILGSSDRCCASLVGSTGLLPGTHRSASHPVGDPAGLTTSDRRVRAEERVGWLAEPSLTRCRVQRSGILRERGVVSPPKRARRSPTRSSSAPLVLSRQKGGDVERPDLAVGSPIEVRNRFEPSWNGGFRIVELTGNGVRLQRESDRYVFPTLFGPDDVRPATKER